MIAPLGLIHHNTDPLVAVEIYMGAKVRENCLQAAAGAVPLKGADSEAETCENPANNTFVQMYCLLQTCICLLSRMLVCQCTHNCWCRRCQMLLQVHLVHRGPQRMRMRKGQGAQSMQTAAGAGHGAPARRIFDPGGS